MTVVDVPFVSAASAALLIVGQQALMLRVGLHRAKTRTAVGLSDDPHLERKVRRHGNLAENAPLFLVVLTLAELTGVALPILVGFAAAFLISRLAHAVGFSSLAGSHLGDGPKLFLRLRTGGALGTVFTGIALGLFLGLHLAAAAAGLR